MSATKPLPSEMTKNVEKALCALERPLDLHQVRAIVLLTHQMKEAYTFWEAAIRRQTLTLNRFSAWKFCNLLHRLLRYGHPQVMHDSQVQRQALQQVSVYWMRHQDAMGRCVGLYCALLQSKLQFHDTYPFFTGSLQLVELRTWDLNTSFQLCSDLLDLLEQCLQLQQATFTALRTQGIAWISERGKCRLLPLLTIAEEALAVYEQCVNFLHLLCAMLMPEDVFGLRERFYWLFEQLHAFYRSLQIVPFLAELLLVPSLPTYPPNFYASLQPELSTLPSAPMESDLLY